MSINELGFVHGFVKSFTSDIFNTNNYTLKMVCSKKNPKTIQKQTNKNKLYMLLFSNDAWQLNYLLLI